MKVISVLILAFALVAAQNVTETKPTATLETGSVIATATQTHVVVITTEPVTATATEVKTVTQEVSTTYTPTTTSFSATGSHTEVFTKSFTAPVTESASSSVPTASTYTTGASTVSPPTTNAVTYPVLTGRWTVLNVKCDADIFDHAYQVSNVQNASLYLFTPTNATFSAGVIIEDTNGVFVGFSGALLTCKGSADVVKNTGNIVCKVPNIADCSAELARSLVTTTSHSTSTVEPTHSTSSVETKPTEVTFTQSHVVTIPNIAGNWDVINMKGPEADKVFDHTYQVSGPSATNSTLFTFTPVTKGFGSGDVTEHVDGTFQGVSGSLVGCHGKTDVNAGTGTIVCTVKGTDLTADLKRQATQPTHGTETGTSKQAPTDSGAAVIAISFTLIAVALF